MAIVPLHNERELIISVAAGDQYAFATLFNAYHNQLGEFVFLLTRSAEMTEEIVQDVFVKVWMERQQLVDVEKFHSWLFILTRNYTLNCMRRLSNEYRKERQHGLYVLSTQSEAELPVGEDADYIYLLEKAVAQLSPQQRKVYCLRREEGLKYAEIGERMGLSRETVKKYLQWATQSIVEFMRQHAVVLAMLAAAGGKL